MAQHSPGCPWAAGVARACRVESEVPFSFLSKMSLCHMRHMAHTHTPSSISVDRCGSAAAAAGRRWLVRPCHLLCYCVTALPREFHAFR